MAARTSRRFRRRLSKRKGKKTRRSAKQRGGGFQIPYSGLTEIEESEAVFANPLKENDSKIVEVE